MKQLKITVEEELATYKRQDHTFKLGQLLRLKDIAYDLVHRMEKVGKFSETHEIFLSNKELDFKHTHYCYHNKEQADEYIIVDPCSKIFSLSFFELSRIFLSRDQVYFLLNQYLLCEVGNNQLDFEYYPGLLDPAQEELYREESRLLSDVIESYENEKGYGLITENERKSQVKTLYWYHLLSVKRKWDL